MVLQNREIDIEHLANEYTKNDKIQGTIHPEEDPSCDECEDSGESLGTQSGIEFKFGRYRFLETHREVDKFLSGFPGCTAVTLGTFQDILDCLKKQIYQMKQLEPQSDVGVIQINIEQLKAGLLPSPISYLDEMHKMLPKVSMLVLHQAWVHLKGNYSLRM